MVMPLGSTSLAITARRGTVASGSQVSGFQSPERRNAFAQWKKMSSISTTTRQDRPVALDDHLVEERRVADQPGAAVDAQRVAAAGDQEVQADVRVGEDVLVAVDPLVAGPLGDRDGGVVDDVDQLAGRVALGRGVAVAVGVGGGDHAERRRGEPVAVDRRAAPCGPCWRPARPASPSRATSSSTVSIVGPGRAAGSRSPLKGRGERAISSRL